MFSENWTIKILDLKKNRKIPNNHIFKRAEIEKKSPFSMVHPFSQISLKFYTLKYFEWNEKNNLLWKISNTIILYVFAEIHVGSSKKLL